MKTTNYLARVLRRCAPWVPGVCIALVFPLAFPLASPAYSQAQTTTATGSARAMPAPTAPQEFGDWTAYPTVPGLELRVRQGDLGVDGRRFWFWQFRNRTDKPLTFSFVIDSTPPEATNARHRHYRLAAAQTMDWNSGDYLADGAQLYSSATLLDVEASVAADIATSPPATDTVATAEPKKTESKKPAIKRAWKDLDLLAQMLRYLLPALSGDRRMKGLTGSLMLLQQGMETAWRSGEETQMAQFGRLVGHYTEALARATSRDAATRTQGLARLNTLSASFERVAANPRLLSLLNPQSGELPATVRPEPAMRDDWELPAPETAPEPVASGGNTTGGAYSGPHQAQVSGLLSSVEYTLDAGPGAAPSVPVQPTDDKAARRAAAKWQFDALVGQLAAIIPHLADEDASASAMGDSTRILQQMRRLADLIDSDSPGGKTKQLVDSTGKAIAESLSGGDTGALPQALERLANLKD